MKKISAGAPNIKKPKYQNKRSEFDGITFDSKKERRRYHELVLMQQAGHIKDLKVHEKYNLFHCDGTPIMSDKNRQFRYEPDFTYIDVKTKERIVEDVKSTATKNIPYFKLKKALFEKYYGLKIRIV